MADFCKQCSTDSFGQDYGDLAGITTKEDQAKGLYAVVLCEGCGPIQVDTEGACISKDCMCNGHPDPEVTHSQSTGVKLAKKGKAPKEQADPLQGLSQE